MRSRGQDSRRFPDPVLTASVYCGGLLDRAFRELLLPLRREFEAVAGGDAYMWTVRYAKGGEHLKLRIHAPAATAAAISPVMRGSIEGFLAGLGPPAAEEARSSRSNAPPIDFDDETNDDYPDRSFRLTRYRRSHVSLGAEPFLEHDAYAALVTLGLARGLEVFLAALERDGREDISHQLRQTTLLKAVISGLAALRGIGPELAASYLAYHRDWLLRFFVQDGDKEKQFLEQLDARVLKMERTAGRLRDIALDQWRQGEAAAGDRETEGWRQALAALDDFLATILDSDDYCVDPFAEDRRFAPVFKVLHGTANQLGLKPLEEAFAHHLLLRATAGADAMAAQPARSVE